MSESKNGQGTQWSKSVVTAASLTAAVQKQQHLQNIQHAPIYNAPALSLTSPISGTSSALYGGTGHLGTHQSSSDCTNYAAARFQAPPIDHRSVSSSSSHIVPPTPSLSSTTNVPVPSGFIPPPFPTVAAAATSVLTPNPYAVASLTVAGTSHSSASHSQSLNPAHVTSNQQFSGPHQMPTSRHAPFGMEQFQHLNVQQQYELSKLMAASFSTTQQMIDSSGPTNLSSNTTSLLASAKSSSTIVPPLENSALPTTAIRHPPPLSSSSTETTSSGNINTQIANQVIGAISTGSSATKLATTPIHGRLMGLGVHAPDEEKLRRIEQVVESGISDNAKQQIVQILDRISTLRPVEKLLLYLRLPGEQPETDPLRQPQNPLGTRSEINHTINWVRTHLEQDPQVSIPKQDVYNDYLVYCDRLDIKPLSTADFGKVMKQVFPGIRPRRLGTRGHSRYCYAAMRKTTKLPAPHLPTLATVKSLKGAGENDGSIDLSTNIIDSTDEQEESWCIVKQWAETILHVKIDNIADLATHIKSNRSTPLAVGTHIPYTGGGKGLSSGGNHKKHTQREPKEKRVMADIGPLKKRRKKKRKGSSSSESSFHQNINTGDQQQMQQQLSPANSSKSGSHHAILSPAMEEIQKVKIKQEVLDSPGYPTSVGSLSTHSQSTDSASVTQYQTPTIVLAGVNTSRVQQHQVLPMNLAAETRGGISNVLATAPATSAPLTSSAFEHVRPSSATTPTTVAATAVKNLTPKIMELSTENQEISSTPPLTVIKQEIKAEEYNTSNIFCKKVRKAQQTKGFWVNSPTSNRNATTTSFPVITTTASTPPPVPASATSASSNNTESVVVYNMGPPTQMAPSTSPNNQSNDDVNSLGQPKVLSRNLQQLKAKKIMAAAAAAGCDPPNLNAAKDEADLPENLGLPRERVISICNMDKHELDDYFLPVEEENSEDQETELLQYFQMGDAEEKLTKNSSSDAKRNSNSTVNQSTSVTTSIQKLTTSNLTKITTSTAGSLKLTSSSTMTTSNISTGMMMGTYKSINNTPSLNDVITNSQLQKGKTPQSITLDYSNSTINSLNKLPSNSTTSSCLTATESSSFSNTVGTASASLAQSTPKHQPQMQQPQEQLQQQKPQPQLYSKVSIKRKISFNTKSTSSDITAARKNYSFLPISPNINSTPTSSSSSSNNKLLLTNNNSITSGTGFFASPGLSRLLSKQQSLDCDTSSDPMIGATRRLRSYNSMMTSASAPPSPSVLKQQQEQQLFGPMSHSILIDQWSHSAVPLNNPTANVPNSLMGDQNSLDLDLFGEAAAAAASTATNTTFNSRNSFHMVTNNIAEEILSNDTDNTAAQLSDFTQRSQSVPLSQLQRSHSPTFNRSFHCGVNNLTAISACNSLAETPVPSEFIDSVTMLSENSCSQQSATIKLEEVTNVVGSDSTALLDEVDVSEILSSPDFVTKFSSIHQTGKTKTTCSSAGSSSGYSSAGHFSLSSGSYNIGGVGIGGGGAGISSSISRSVPSTPLPHQNPQSLFGNGNNFYRRRFISNCQTLNGGAAGGNVLDNLNSFSSNFSSTGKYVYSNISSSLSRSACDISKSMPSTPITTTPSNFRYSPSEFTRDFLINGNTIDDSITSSFGAVGSDNLMVSDVVGVDASLNSESLLNEEDTLINGSTAISQVDCDVLTSDFAVQPETSVPGLGEAVGESVVIGVGSELLDSL